MSHPRTEPKASLGSDDRLSSLPWRLAEAPATDLPAAGDPEITLALCWRVSCRGGSSKRAGKFA
jgi:hypothetical protein